MLKTTAAIEPASLAAQSGYVALLVDLDTSIRRHPAQPHLVSIPDRADGHLPRAGYGLWPAIQSCS